MTTDKQSAQITVLIVDDDSDMRKLLNTWLNKGGYQVLEASSGDEALSQIAMNKPHLVLTDLFMDGMDGMTLLSEIHRRNPLLPVIMLSGQAQIPDAIKATHLGTSAFLTKPIEKERLLEEIDRCVKSAVSGASADANEFARGLVYRSEVMDELMEQARMVAEGDITVFISGETGTGKEVLAKAIHQVSPRRDEPFIGVNCGAIPDNLLESELFGHEKGAFTGANTKHTGLFQAADGGTLFLDEIGDMPLDLQVKLLRVLQDFEVRPVGSTRSVPINVRVISATHQNLEQAVEDGEFREDLYYRLNVFPLQMPSLAERRDDIPLLAEHFLEQFAHRREQGRKRFAPDAMQYLASAAWPGNVRQLGNVIELCATLTRADIIPLPTVQRALRDKPAEFQTLKDAKHEFERKYLLSVLRVTNGHVANAARIAGRNRTEFYKLLNLHDLDAADFRANKKTQEDES